MTEKRVLAIIGATGAAFTTAGLGLGTVSTQVDSDIATIGAVIGVFGASMGAWVGMYKGLAYSKEPVIGV